MDSLRKVLPLLRDTARIDCLNAISNEYISTEKKDSAEFYAVKAGLEAKAAYYIHGIAASLLLRSQIAKHFDDDFVQSEIYARAISAMVSIHKKQRGN